jgi:hypothetical protein
MAEIDTPRSDIWTRSARQQVRWLGAGLVLAFGIPFVFADVLNLPRDLYYGIYAVTVVVFFVLWARFTGQPIDAMIRRRWRLATVLGLVFTILVAVIVIRTEPATYRPQGLSLVGAVLWRGLVYGAADGLLLSAFPILAVFAGAVGSRPRRGRSGTAVAGAVALLASLVMTAVYHLGYSDFRSVKLLKPLAGDLIWSVPTLVTLNPVGAPITHAGMHVTAVLHAYETDTFLPPHQ